MKYIYSEFGKIIFFSLESMFVRIVLIFLLIGILNIVSKKVMKNNLKKADTPIRINNIGNVRFMLILVVFVQYVTLIFFGGVFLKENLSQSLAVINKVFDLSGIVSLFTAVILICYLSIMRDNLPFRSLGFEKKNIKKGLLWGISFFLLFFNFRIIIFNYFDIIPHKVINDFSVLKIILTIVMAPIIEEIFYRGYIYGQLRSKLGVMLGAFFSSLFFVILHINWEEYILVFILGLIFVFLYEKSGSLIAAIIAHIVINLLAVISSYQSGSILKNLTIPMVFFLTIVTIIFYILIKKYMPDYNAQIKDAKQ